MYGDSLFSASVSSRSMSPNSGFTLNRISPVPGYGDPLVSASDINDTDELEQNANVTENAEDKTNNNEDITEETQLSTTTSTAYNPHSEPDDTNNNINAIMNDNTQEGNGGEDDTIASSQLTPTEAMDKLFEIAFLRCLKYLIKDDTLPQPVSSIWATVLK